MDVMENFFILLQYIFLKASRRDDGFFKYFQGVFWASIVTMWSIERFSLHVCHTGAGCFGDEEGVGEVFVTSLKLFSD